MKAVLDGVIIAEADRDDLVSIEGNWYFPPRSIREGALEKSPTPYTCPWKGAAQYWSVNLDGVGLVDGAWSYPELRPGAAQRAGTDFAGYVAFDPRISVVD
ncbi:MULTISPECIES: DUF427 domain-containing protein [unclassified Microbacterium]|uniref:DUF427 domain-containing protein n=1 Tax=unclassified Microbacterium TaxID=2609290 RepID=UPI0037471DC6